MANEKVLHTRIKLKYDLYSTWATKNPVLLAGEVALAYIPTENGVTVGEGSVAGTTPPQVLIKVGDGTNHYNDLKYVSALAADVLAACKTEAGLTAFVNNLITAANLAAAGDLEALAGRVTKLEGDVNTEGSVAKAIKDAIDALDLANTYAAKEHEHTVSEITDFDEKVKEYATKTEAQGYANAKDEAIAAAKKAGDDAQDAIDAYIESNDEALAGVKTTAEQGVADAAKVAGDLSTHIGESNGKFETKDDASQKLADAKKYTDDKIAEIPAQTDYTVTITETTDGLDASIAKKYTFTQNGAEIGSINLAKELVVTAGSVKEVAEADVPYAGAVVGDKYIELVIANQDAPIYVPAKDLVDIYTATENAAEVQVAISNENKISATLVAGGVTEEKLADGVKTKLNKTWEEVGVAKGLVDALAETHATDKAALEKAITDGDAATLEAAQGKVDALADGQVKANKEAIEAINDAETGILKQAKDYADGLADDYATAEQGGKADTAVQSISTPTTQDAEGNTIPNGLKAVKDGTDVAISIDDSVVFIFDCGTSDIQ